MLDWKRVLRTLIQSAAGAGIVFATAIGENYSRESISLAIVQFLVTVVVAVLMNIKKQTEDEEK